MQARFAISTILSRDWLETESNLTAKDLNSRLWVDRRRRLPPDFDFIPVGVDRE